MSTHFGRIGGGRQQTNRERLLFLGGGTILFSLVLIGGLILYNRQVVQANQPISAQKDLSDESVFNTVMLVAPAEDVPQGAKLNPMLLREVSWPRDGVPEGAVRDLGALQQMYAKVPLPANQPILRNGVSPTAPTFGIGELLPAGHRAVTIEVDATSGVEGWATPGAHVDVLLTYLDKDEEVTKTRVAVEDAVVLSFDGSTKQVNSPTTGKVNPASTVTLSVSFENSLRIQTARAMGRISLALRNANDGRSMGDQIFGSGDFDAFKPRKSNKISSSKGYATFKDEKGDKQFVIENGIWSKSDDGN